MSSKLWKATAATVVALVCVSAALAWYDTLPDRRRDDIERQIATIEADARGDAAERVREVASCTADGVEFGADSHVATTCWAGLRASDEIRLRANAARGVALDELRAKLMGIK